ncbi:uncharacterized protein DEA37_0010981 [Paragonimus westermani]|uniref:Cornifelin n=1 Tax=Paragonimus westermani TaxID=34504 RepID=A0A5J4NRE5_9TREM|nr:uncharacterized protein DEA37_0010981 [Paragonimus westermani]
MDYQEKVPPPPYPGMASTSVPKASAPTATPLLSQPNQINVIVNQPEPTRGTGYRDWHDGLCSCGNNCGNCLLTAFFYPCVECHMYQRYGECCCTPCVIPMSGMVLAVKHRSRHRIVGSISGDCCTFMCCAPCALCRLYRDMVYVEGVNGTLS